MLVEWFLDGLVTVVGGLFSAVLPVSTSSPTIPPLVFRGYAWVDGMLPLSEALVLVVLYYGVAGVLFAYAIVREIRKMFLP